MRRCRGRGKCRAKGADTVISSWSATGKVRVPYKNERKNGKSEKQGKNKKD